MKYYKIIGKLILLICLFGWSSCSKSFLDKKPKSDIIQPNTVEDLQGLLDNFEVFNANYPSLPQLSCDDYYYLSKTAWEGARSAVERHSYIWDKDVYGGVVGILSWNGPYSTIFYANSIIESANGIPVTPQNEKGLNNVIGAAHFYRSFAYFELLKSFSPAYDQSTAATDLGVPLKLRPGIDEIVPRSSVQQCYEQVIEDLLIAKGLLTDVVPGLARNRPSKLVSYALFARIYLSMRKYDLAFAYADSTLRYYNKLIDYNTVSSSASTPFTLTNDETLFSSALSSYNAIAYRNMGRNLTIDTTLMASYHTNDLRKTVYFTLDIPGIYYVRRGYYGSGLTPYNGLASDEMYLIKAETAARLNRTEEAMEVLNALLVKRFKTGTFVPLTAGSASEALQIVLNERRKELVWRGLRWDDLKRLNREGANITLVRYLDGEQYTLLPNDQRWVFNIPQDEINYSGIQQNPR